MTTPNILDNQEYIKIKSTASNILDAVRMANELDVDNTEKAEARMEFYLSYYKQKDMKNLLISMANRQSALEHLLKDSNVSTDDAKEMTLEIQAIKDLREKVMEARHHLLEIVW
ncbi:hypothetical protein [Exiguobacterium sp. s102]|uniref:hypothetical protein n=1 Tax=Exiguobacterium sp. s102 TaxID=2751212 RepID=UPI001BE59488|nr:hypothetical protein [Exiguobacterium sp. s102]